jgi:hypothetical protein
MPQSHIDDHFDTLELFAEQVFIFLSLNALQRRLSADEVWVLDRAAKVSALIHPENGGRVHLHIVSRGG